MQSPTSGAHTHAHGFWVGMGAILLFMGGHMLTYTMGGHRSLLMVMVWVRVQIRRKMLGSAIYSY